MAENMFPNWHISISVFLPILSISQGLPFPGFYYCCHVTEFPWGDTHITTTHPTNKATTDQSDFSTIVEFWLTNEFYYYFLIGVTNRSVDMGLLAGSSGN